MCWDEPELATRGPWGERGMSVSLTVARGQTSASMQEVGKGFPDTPEETDTARVSRNP